MLSEELVKKIGEAEDKARKWDKMSGRYLEVAGILQEGLKELQSAMEKISKAVGMIDPMAAPKIVTHRTRVTDIDVYVNALTEKIDAGTELSLDSIMSLYPDLPEATAKYIFTAKLGKIPGIVKYRNGRKLILKKG